MTIFNFILNISKSSGIGLSNPILSDRFIK